MKRFRLEGFDVRIKVEDGDDGLVVSGRVYVEAALFFNATVSLSYRLVVNGEVGFCRASKSVNSDNIIVLAGVPLGVEHSFPSEGGKRAWGVDFKVPRFEVHNLLLDAKGGILGEPVSIQGSNEVFHETMARYRYVFDSNASLPREQFYDSKFVVIDVWEDLLHSGAEGVDFSKLTAPEIVAHIEEKHKDELMGLLTLYPFEWPYRDEKSFLRVCGENIAIDTDDLVLVSDNVGLIVGTYGLRGSGSPTDWRGYLKERRSRDHVCWPECLHILEIAVAQLHTINYALYKVHSMSVNESQSQSSKFIIRHNSLLALNVGRIITDMDVVKFSRYASHKELYKEIEERLEIRRDLDVLIGALARVDTAIKNIDSMDEVARSRIIRLLLAFITISSVFQVLFEDLRLPIVGELWGEQFARTVAVDVLTLVGVGLILISGAALIAGVLRIASTILRRAGLRRG